MFNSCVCDRWKDIGTIAHNKSAITVEITSRDDTIAFHMVGVVSAGGLSSFTHKLFQQAVLLCLFLRCFGKEKDARDTTRRPSPFTADNLAILAIKKKKKKENKALVRHDETDIR